MAKPCILVSFAFNADYNKRMQKVPGSKWSQTYNAWTIPDNTENRQKCGLSSDSHVTTTSLSTTKTALCCLSNNNKEELNKFLLQLSLKAYSASTIRTYRNEFTQLLHALNNVKVQSLQPHQLQRYLLYCISKGLKENSVHSRLNALKFYYEQVLKKDKMFFEIPRPKKPELLPHLFSKEQIAAIINSAENIQQRTVLMLTYACGLRVSEAAALHVSDIDSSRMVIHIRHAKGKKDRVVTLSPVILIMLREYYTQYQPKIYLFEGQHSGEHYSVRSIQQALYNAKHKARIFKPGGVHLLRHSFATHLIDKGIDVVLIQKLLGHNDVKTTLRYLHVSNRGLQKILSPVEDIAGLLTTANN